MKMPASFIADLRRLKNWPSMHGSLWRRPYLIELTHAEACRLVTDSIRGKKLKILDVGCGTGFMCLEFYRMGHDVFGIDKNKEAIRVAKRTANTASLDGKSGNLRYEAAEFDKWPGTSESYDIILFSRLLHDLPYPEKVLSKAHGLLKNEGKLVCLEYAYNRMNRRAAIWLYQIRRALELEGWYSSPPLPENPQSGVDHIMQETLSGRKEHINTFEEMIGPLERLFGKESLSWHPYYFWDVLGDVRIPNLKIEKSFARMVKEMEEFLIRTGEIQPVLFRFIGTKVQPRSRSLSKPKGKE